MDLRRAPEMALEVSGITGAPAFTNTGRRSLHPRKWNYLRSMLPISSRVSTQSSCARYLEYLIEERHEELPVYHDRLAELYLQMTMDAKKAGDESMHHRL